MLKLKTYQQCIVGIIATIAFFIIGFLVLAISLISANRNQAASIKEIFTTPITSEPSSN